MKTPVIVIAAAALPLLLTSCYTTGNPYGGGYGGGYAAPFHHTRGYNTGHRDGYRPPFQPPYPSQPHGNAHYNTRGTAHLQPAHGPAVTDHHGNGSGHQQGHQTKPKKKHDQH